MFQSLSPPRHVAVVQVLGSMNHEHVSSAHLSQPVPDCRCVFVWLVWRHVHAGCRHECSPSNGCCVAAGLLPNSLSLLWLPAAACCLLRAAATPCTTGACCLRQPRTRFSPLQSTCSAWLETQSSSARPWGSTWQSIRPCQSATCTNAPRRCR